MNKSLSVLQLELLVKGQAAALKQALERSPDHRRFFTRLLKALRAYSVLLDSVSKATGPQSPSPLIPHWHELLSLLEARQNLSIIRKLLKKLKRHTGKAVFIWMEEQLRQREDALEKSIRERRQQLLKHRKHAKPPALNLELLTDGLLWRQQTVRLSRIRRQMKQHFNRLARRKVTGTAVRPLRELLRQYREHLDWMNRVFEIPLPCDPKLLAACHDRLKRIDRWRALEEWLEELEPQTATMPGKIFSEWQEFRGGVRNKLERRLKKLRKAISREGTDWAGLQFTLAQA